MTIAENASLFSFKQTHKQPVQKHPVFASWDDIGQFLKLADDVKNTVKKNLVDKTLPISHQPTLSNSVHFQVEIEEPTVLPINTGQNNQADYLTILNVGQKRAHNMIANHLDAHLGGKRPPQMLMIVTSLGGTGKSTLLNTIMKAFEHHQSSHLLSKTAMSGVSATVIGGATLDWWGGNIPVSVPNSNNWMVKKSTTKAMHLRCKKKIAHTQWLAINEISMLTIDMLTVTSQVMRYVKTGNGSTDSAVPFSSLNMLLMGAFHKFPPVANSLGSLYQIHDNG